MALSVGEEGEVGVTKTGVIGMVSCAASHTPTLPAPFCMRNGLWTGPPRCFADGDRESHVALIVGCVVGGVVALLLVLGLGVVLLRKRGWHKRVGVVNEAKVANAESDVGNNSHPLGIMTEHTAEENENVLFESASHEFGFEAAPESYPIGMFGVQEREVPTNDEHSSYLHHTSSTLLHFSSPSGALNPQDPRSWPNYCHPMQSNPPRQIARKSFLNEFDI